MTTSEQATTVPVVTFDYTSTEPEGTWFAKYDELRSQFPWYRNDFGPGFWTVCNYQGILEIMQNPEVFSNSVVTALDPNPPVKWIPEMLDGDEHKQWRRQLGPLFSPGAVERLESTVRQRAIDIIDGLADRGSCDFMADFATRFPTTIFLEMMGLPVEELDQFLDWEHDILHAGGSDEEKLQKQIAAMMAVMGRFATVIAERREEPRDDIVSKALTYEIDGKPVTDEDLLSFCLLMFMAGLRHSLGHARLDVPSPGPQRRRPRADRRRTGHHPHRGRGIRSRVRHRDSGAQGDGRHRDSGVPDEDGRHGEHPVERRHPRRGGLRRCDDGRHHP